jgi:hypothetical protein
MSAGRYPAERHASATVTAERHASATVTAERHASVMTGLGMRSGHHADVPAN